ncbi:hypothetical protein TNCV_333981 [Trichonephila clavipes]|nr:hypothetical protein TNCV_333981 [Trichonephila clavipes]
MVFEEGSLLDSKLVLGENGRGVSDFRLYITHNKRSDDSRLRDALVLDFGLPVTPFKMLSSRLGLRTALRQPTSCVVTRGTNVFHEVDDVTAEKFCEPEFID